MLLFKKPVSCVTTIATVLLAGCSWLGPDDHEQTIRNGVRVLPHVAEMQKVFPGAEIEHSITHFGFSTNAVPWTSSVYWKDRYVCKYQVYVRVDYTNKAIAKVVGSPTIRLWEVSEVYTAASSNIGARIANDYDIKPDQWQMVVTNHGDFSVIGIDLKTNAPIPGFQTYVQAVRKGLVLRE